MPDFVAADGVKLYYEAVGRGPAIVLQTGGAGAGSMWRDAGYVEALSSIRRCLLFDHRGHGRSDQPPLAEAHTMQTYVGDIVALLDHAGLERAAFWGYSQAAEIGLALTALHPDRLTALVTTGVITNPDRNADAAETAEAIERIRKRGWEGILDASALASTPSWFRRQVEKTNPEMLRLWLEAYGDWNPWARLPEIATPILMFVGELEDPQDWNSRAARLAANARVVRLPGLDHLGAYIRADLVLPEAIEFLSSSPGPSSREPDPA